MPCASSNRSISRKRAEQREPPVDCAVDKAKEHLSLLGADAPTAQVANATALPTPPVAAATSVPGTSRPPRRPGCRHSDYRYAGKLANPTNDESDFAKTLRQLGFEVVAGSNLDRHGRSSENPTNSSARASTFVW
jgi:hypothetical protein